MSDRVLDGLVWEFRRDVKTSSIVYDRYWHDVGGAAVLYGSDRPDLPRHFLLIINGQKYYLPYPDSGERYHNPEGDIDAGNPLGARIRWDKDNGWTVYGYFFNGNNNPHPEWVVQIPA